MKRSVLFCRLLVSAMVLALAGCSTTPPSAPPLPRIEAPDELQRAAREYSRLADLATGTERYEYQLLAGETLLQGKYLDAAKRILAQIDPINLTPQQLVRRQMLLAGIALEEHDTRQALEALEFPLPADTSAATRVDVHRMRANAYALEGQLAASLQERMLLERLLDDPEETRRARESIWQGLMILPSATLEEIRGGLTSDLVDGWFELAHIARSFRLQPEERGTRVADWRQRFPDHPANLDIALSLQGLQPGDGQRPEHFALLLPLSGQFATPAAALRDGFLAAYYERADKTYQPSIRIYDVGGEDTDVRAIYQQAVADGADFVVGPLSKQHLHELAGAETLPVTVLALNTVEANQFMPPNFFQFGLAPEDEARQVAERAWLDGHIQPLAIVPRGDWGERVLRAFNERWQQLTGTISPYQTYDQQQSDFSNELKELFHLDRSEARYRTLKRQLGLDIKFEPRRRQDIDFIFLAALPNQGRLIEPQIRFHRAAGIPVYATSHIYAGYPDRSLDRDLDGIIFPDTPWLLEPAGEHRALQQQILALWPDTARSYLRFYALGIDAFNIPGNLAHLSRYQYERYDGYTGSLRVDEFNRIHRQLAWARFRAGQPQLLETSLMIQP